MAVDNSPFGTDYKGLSLKKDSEEARMESYQRDKRPIYALSSFPVLDRGRADSRSKERGRPAAQVHREDRPSASHALGRAGGKGSPTGPPPGASWRPSSRPTTQSSSTPCRT